MTADLMYRLTRERLLERMHDADRERLALHLPGQRRQRPRRRLRMAMLGHLLAVRRHAAQ